MLQPGDQIDIWVIEKSLGSGGMGSVYRCHNRNASRILAAVKVLDAALRKYPEAEARFVREAEILFQLDHPNIVKVRNVRTDAEPPYLEMEFVEGESVEERLRRGALPFDQAVDYVTQMCSAVAYLHKKGVRHRDIKPANLLITKDGRIKLVDFGLAMEADTTRITQTGMTFGTVSYAPPEWIAPDTLDPAKWDLYAVGVVSYEMLTGRHAFPVSGQGSARQQAMQVIVGKQAHAPLDPGDAFHEDMRALIRDLTQSDASKRVSSAAEAVRRSRQLVRTLKRAPGVTLAPQDAESWADDDLDRSPEPAPDRPQAHTWLGPEPAAEPELAAPEPSPPTHAEAPALSSRPRTPPTSPPARAIGLGLLAALLLGVGASATAAVGLAAWWWGGSTRAVDVAITGVPPDTRVGMRLGGAAPTTTRGMVSSFADLPTGPGELVWTLGDRCQPESCPGATCPAWCGHGTQTVVIERGPGPQVITLDLAPPQRRRVRVRTPALTGTWALDFELSGTPGRPVEGGVLFDDVLPGPYKLIARVGTCAPTDLGCWPDGSCPPGCGSYRDELVVPWGGGEFAWDLEMPDPRPADAAPAPKGAPTPTPGPAPTQTPAPPAPTSTTGAAAHPVTVGAFAAWLATHPDWQQEAAIADGRASGSYLAGWSGATPPPGLAADAAMTNVSWYAASAFCTSRGGLAPFDAEPLRWTEDAAHPYIEFRIKGGSAAWHTSDGRDSARVGLADVPGMTGFRCAR